MGIDLRSLTDKWGIFQLDDPAQDWGELKTHFLETFPNATWLDYGIKAFTRKHKLAKITISDVVEAYSCKQAIYQLLEAQNINVHVKFNKVHSALWIMVAETLVAYTLFDHILVPKAGLDFQSGNSLHQLIQLLIDDEKHFTQRLVVEFDPSERPKILAPVAQARENLLSKRGNP